MKHGPIALLDKGSPVVVVADDSPVLPKIVSNIEEVRARGADVIAVATKGNETIEELASEVLWIPPCDPLLAPVLAVVPLQLLAYDIAQHHGAERRPAAQPGQDRDGGVILPAWTGSGLRRRHRRDRRGAPAASPRPLSARLRAALQRAGAALLRRLRQPVCARYAARFAAKEAVGKALGIGIIGFVWREIEVLSGGKPLVALHGGVARVSPPQPRRHAHRALAQPYRAGLAYASADVAVATSRRGTVFDSLLMGSVHGRDDARHRRGRHRRARHSRRAPHGARRRRRRRADPRALRPGVGGRLRRQGQQRRRRVRGRARAVQRRPRRGRLRRRRARRLQGRRAAQPARSPKRSASRSATASASPATSPSTRPTWSSTRSSAPASPAPPRASRRRRSS